MLIENMPAKVRKTIEKHHMLRKGDHLLVGVSGGADSVALLSVLNRLRPVYGLILTASHFNHGMRAAESDRDEAFVRSLCESMGVPLLTGALKEGSCAGGLSVEDFLRRHRYAFFEKARREAGALRVALGHHQGDQAETVLMNMIRGTGLGGLSGIPPVRDGGTFIRPLIDCSRYEIADYLAEKGLCFVEDRSNTDERFLRNRVRHCLMPELVNKFNPSIGETLCRLADVCREENDYMTAEAGLYLTRWKDGRAEEMPLEVPIAELLRLHAALQRRIILTIVRSTSAADSAIGFEHVKAVMDLAGGSNPGGSLDLPGGLVVKRTYGLLEFSPVEDAGGRTRGRMAPGRPGNAFNLEVPVPGIVRIASLGMSIRFREIRGVPSLLESKRKAYLDLDRIVFPLVLRSVQPGDRIQPLGMKGTRKLKSVFIDEKIPRRLRGAIPVLADGISVLWVPGVRLSERVRVGKGTERVLSAEIV